MHFLTDYGLFLAKIATLIIAIFILLIGVLAIVRKAKTMPRNKIQIKKLNEQYQEYEDTLNNEILTKPEHKKYLKQQKVKQKQQDKKEESKKRIFVLHFIGDLRASATAQLREEISAILCVASPQDEVVVCLESAGGMVSHYGLAASQLRRLRNKQIPLTIIIDKVAASGGYMMACVGDKILAAPFAIIGSVGVLVQLPNFHRFLKKKDIDFEQLTAGQYKRTLTMFGENTEAGRQKMQEEIEDIHQLFKAFIAQNRQQVDVNQIATGEYWLGARAQELKLVDDLITSDDYLLAANDKADIYHVYFSGKKSMGEKISSAFSSMMSGFHL
jgi:serine protease SohB